MTNECFMLSQQKYFENVIIDEEFRKNLDAQQVFFKGHLFQLEKGESPKSIRLTLICEGRFCKNRVDGFSMGVQAPLITEESPPSQSSRNFQNFFCLSNLQFDLNIAPDPEDVNRQLTGTFSEPSSDSAMLSGIFFREEAFFEFIDSCVASGDLDTHFLSKSTPSEVAEIPFLEGAACSDLPFSPPAANFLNILYFPPIIPPSPMLPALPIGPEDINQQCVMRSSEPQHIDHFVGGKFRKSRSGRRNEPMGSRVDQRCSAKATSGRSEKADRIRAPYEVYEFQLQPQEVAKSRENLKLNRDYACPESLFDSIESLKAPKKGGVKTMELAQGFCNSCSTTRTPQWRVGPAGLRTLCNACGLQYAKNKKLSLVTSASGCLPDPQNLQEIFSDYQGDKPEVQVSS